jgi:hypothetical protein
MPRKLRVEYPGAIASRVRLGTSRGARANLHKWMFADRAGNPAEGQLRL